MCFKIYLMKNKVFSKIAFFAAFLMFQPVFGQKNDATLLEMLGKNNPKFEKILANPEKYRVQIVYTQIDRDAQNRPTFTTHRFRADPKEYFYPASTVKFPACLLALEKINHLNNTFKFDIQKDAPMFTESVNAIADYPPQYMDTTSATKMPSVAHYVKKILLVSDNDAFNRLYEFVGQEAFNKNLYLKNYKNLRIRHRLSIPLSTSENAQTNAVSFWQSGKTIYKQPEQISAMNFDETPITLGNGFMKGEKLVNEPFDFTFKNHFALEDQQRILRAVLFPEATPAEEQFDLTTSDYDFLYRYMSMSPLESRSPRYPDADSAGAWDSYCKFLIFGNSKEPMPKNIRIFNKVGDAYGFLIDNAYVVDFERGVEFLLSATIYCNSDEIFNDDKYDYQTTGFPFMADLGKAIYEYECQRKRKFAPKLDKFKLDYNKF